MIQKPGTFRDLIARLGGASKFARSISVGREAAQKMVERNSIAVEHWNRVIEVARADGLILTTDDFVNMKLASGQRVAA